MSNRLQRFLVTGGAGFIGSAFIRMGLLRIPDCAHIVNLDLLTYAANLNNLSEVAHDPRYVFVQGDVRDEALVDKLIREHNIDAIVHFAAESHVDRSILGPRSFYDTNVGGTLSLLEVVRRHPQVHFHQISTDEVFGSLAEVGCFTETSPYLPNSPYSASKAAADHFVRSYAHTYGISTSISYCTNNYGPYQYVEKLIPRMIAALTQEKPLPIYGKGDNVRDWIYVDDHVDALWKILAKKPLNAIYGIGGECEKKNVDVVHCIVDRFAALHNRSSEPLRALIAHVEDRLGHDQRYAIDCTKIKREIDWHPKHDFASGIEKTIAWYLKHPERLVL
jgi:dTDP-glucose 4,6-dehydratase